MFAVFGSELGSETLQQAGVLPLPTDLAGTSVQVTVQGITVDCFLIFTSSGQLAVVLPSNTPTGEGTLTVTYEGETSQPVPIKVVESSFGIFTRNQAGFGYVDERAVEEVFEEVSVLVERIAAHE